MSVSRCCLGLPEFSHDYGSHKSVMLEMRDGVRLNTNIYFPEGDGPWPVVLIRSPYNEQGWVDMVAKTFTYYGYVGIHQDVRGRFSSEGVFHPFINERKDGLDTLEWLIAQEWQDGNIGMFGESYFGFTPLIVADKLPPEVKTIVPLATSTNFRCLSYEGGMCRVDAVLGLSALLHDKDMDIMNGSNFHKALKHLPANEADEVYFGKKLAWFREFISVFDSDYEHPELLEICRNLPERIDVPVLMITGWYDLYCDEQIEDFNRLKSRDKSRIMVTPWDHMLGTMGKGERDFPDAGYMIKYFPRILNWFGHHLRGEKLEEWGPIEIYAIGSDRWETYNTWPPEGRTERFYLSNTAEANKCEGGKLAKTPSKKSEEISYIYDPMDPVPTRGGHSLLMYSFPGYGGEDPVNQDQEGLCEREDVITYISEPFEKPLSIRGAVKINLPVSSDAKDTAFTAKLIEIDPDGLAYNITDSIFRLEFMKGRKTRVNYKPGEKVILAFDLHPTAWTVKPGYRLRLDISSSNFPAFHAHSNRSGNWAEQTEPVKAKQTIYTGNGQSAFIELPVI